MEGMDKQTMISKSRLKAFPASRQLFENEIWFDSKEAADYLRITENSLRIKVHRGELHAYRLGRSLRFKKSELFWLLEISKGGI